MKTYLVAHWDPNKIPPYIKYKRIQARNLASAKNKAVREIPRKYMIETIFEDK